MQKSDKGHRPQLASVSSPLTFRHPVREDGQAVHDLIDSCEALDDNSLYCNFLQCTHFASRLPWPKRPVAVVWHAA